MDLEEVKKVLAPFCISASAKQWRLSVEADPDEVTTILLMLGYNLPTSQNMPYLTRVVDAEGFGVMWKSRTGASRWMIDLGYL